MTHQHADATWIQQRQTRRTRRPDVRSRQGRVLLKRETSPYATESVSYDLAIERSTSRTSERASERASERVGKYHRGAVSSIQWLRIDAIQLLKKLSNVSTCCLYSHSIFILGRSPWCRLGIYFPAPTSRGRTIQRARSPSVLPHIRRLRLGSFIIL